MTNDLETVAAFVDGERVDPAALKRALAGDEGRDYLMELVAMRELVGDSAPPERPSMDPAAKPSSWRRLAVAAIVTVTVGVAGYALGHFDTERRIAAEREAANRAPTPTREIPPEAATLSDRIVGGL